MLKAIRDLLSELSRDRPARRFDADDYRLAAVALLYHVVAIDGSVSDAERSRLHKLVSTYFSLDDAETDALLSAAEEADNQAVDLFGFTSVLKRALSEEERGKIVEMMWQLTYADGALHEFEDNVLWRVAELLGISSRERIRLKKAAQDKIAPA